MTTERNPDPVAEAVATLIHAAGRRESPPLESYSVVLEAAETTLRAKVRRRRRWHLAIGVAASLAVVALALGVQRMLAPEPAQVEVARVDRLLGGADLLVPDAAAWRPVDHRDSMLRAGTRLRTRERGLVGLVLADGVSVRVHSMTEVELGDDARVYLRHGAVYADTGVGDRGTVTVVTAGGTAHDYGTQFEVRFRDERLRLRVREGRVALLRDAGQHIADAGTQISVDASGAVSRAAIERNDASWRWAESVAPVPELDGKPVVVLLEWVARETGRTLRYADAAAERQASATVLHGRPGPLGPFELLDAMLATTDLAYEVTDDGTIEIRRR